MCKLSEKFYSKFANYLLRDREMVAQYLINSKGVGTIQRNLYYPFLKRALTVVPPRDEQIAIANFLDDKVSKIDEAIAQKEQLIQLLNERKQIIIQNAVTKGLNPNAPMKDSGIEWIGKTPEHWEVKKLKYLGYFINGYAFPSGDFTENGIRVMKISNIQTMQVDWQDSSYVGEKYWRKCKNFRVLDGDLVFALTRPVISTGIKATIYRGTDQILLNQRNSVLRTKGNVSLSWLYFTMLTDDFVGAFQAEIDNTGQQPNISTYSIGELAISYPPINEQEKIQHEIESLSIKIDKAIKLSLTVIDKLKEYKSTLINSVVTGKIKVS